MYPNLPTVGPDKLIHYYPGYSWWDRLEIEIDVGHRYLVGGSGVA